MLDAGLKRLDSDSKSFFQENDQLESADRVQDSAGDQGRSRCQLPRILAREEFFAR